MNNGWGFFAVLAALVVVSLLAAVVANELAFWWRDWQRHGR